MFHRKNGFTLIELMVAVLILGIVTSQTFMVLTTQKRVFTQSEKALDVQEDARLVVDLIAFDTRQAGFMVPSLAAISSVDGGTTNSDRYCVSDSTYFDFPGPTDVSESLDAATTRVDRSEVTALNASTVTVSDLDIDLDNTNVDFVADGGIILSDGTSSHCARIDSLTGAVITFASGQGPAGGLFPDLTAVRAVPAIIYEVDDSNFQLSRNGLVLASAVEDLQIEYWVDTGATAGQIDAPDEFPVHDLNNPGALTMDTSAMRSVRITVVTRAAQEEGGPTQKYDQFTRPAAGNRDAGAADSFRRRRFQASVTPRNLGS